MSRRRPETGCDPRETVQPERRPKGEVEGAEGPRARDRLSHSTLHGDERSPDPSTPALRAYAQGERLHELGRFLRAQVSSSIATVVDWGLMLALISSGVNFLIAVAVGHVAGALTDFTVKKRWAFAAGGGAGPQAWRYGVAWVGSLAFNELAAWWVVACRGVPAEIGVLLAHVGVALCWNYPMHRLFVFGPRLRLQDGRAP